MLYNVGVMLLLNLLLILIQLFIVMFRDCKIYNRKIITKFD